MFLSFFIGASIATSSSGGFVLSLANLLVRENVFKSYRRKKKVSNNEGDEECVPACVREKPVS